MRMTGVTTMLAACLLAVSPSDVAVARADYAASVAQGQEPRYLALATEDPSLIAATQFMVCVASKSQVLDGVVPQRMPGTMLLRVDLRACGWSVASWKHVTGFKNNPTTPYEDALIVDCNWFLNELADGTESGAYLDLLFNLKRPKNVDEFLAAFGIDRKKQGGLAYGVIPQSSGVNLASNAARLLEHSDGINAEAWITWDVTKVEPGSDPLEGLFAGEFKFDGIEGYALTTRVITGPDGRPERVTIPVPFLANAKQEIVFEAPGNLVADHTRLFGDEVIRAPASCFVCHTDGSQPVNGNALAEALRQGVELKAYDYARQQQIEFYHLADIEPELERWDRGLGMATERINGLTTAETAAAIKQAIATYRADLTLESAAAEVSVTPDELRNALALASRRYVAIGARLAGLAHGSKIPRSSWEAERIKVQQYIKEWRQ